MSPFDAEQLAQASAILLECRTRGLSLATAESCTGGLIAACFTEIAGSSDVFERGFVTYSNAAKQELLGVKPSTLQRFGAVSGETALEMATGALAASRASLALSVTGIAGPGGGSPEKPVGLVYFGVATSIAQSFREFRFGDIGRSKVREQALSAALHLVSETLASRP